MKRMILQTIHQVVCTVISIYISTDAIDLLFFFLLKFLNCTILTQYTYIVRKNKFYLHRNISQRFAFLNVSKTPTDKKSLKYINNIHIILYISPHEVTCNLQVFRSLLLTISCAFVLGTSRRRKVDNKDQFIQGNIVITDRNYNGSYSLNTNCLFPLRSDRFQHIHKKSLKIHYTHNSR